MTKAAANRHIVDQLADVRAQSKELAEREALLKEQILKAFGKKDILRGDEFVAFRSTSVRKGNLDEQALRAKGIDPDRYRKPELTIVGIRLERAQRPRQAA